MARGRYVLQDAQHFVHNTYNIERRKISIRINILYIYIYTYIYTFMCVCVCVCVCVTEISDTITQLR